MSRSRRRREAREQGKGAGSTPGLFGRREIIGAAVLAAGVAGVIGGLALFAGGDADDGSPAASQAPAFSPSTPDEAAIDALARRSIEVLPAGEWPSLYDDFTPEFQARCARDQFEAGGESSAADLGTNLQLLGYRRLEEVTITSDAGSAIIVGELRGQSEYRIRGSFQRVDGNWKIAPATDTLGCEAFTRIE